MRFLYIVFLLIFVSCKKEKVRLQEDFVFSYDAGVRIKSLKFKNDTVFIAHSYPSKIKAYFYLIDDNEKIKINKFLETIKGNNYKKEYINESVDDGFSYQFEFLRNKKRVYVQNFESYEIKNITEFADYLIHIDRYKKEIEHYNLKIDFGNVDVFYPPEPNPFE